MKSHYEVLGVKQNATAEEIGKAFRALLRQLHPDMGGKGGKELEAVVEAHKVLSDPVRRKKYNDSLSPVLWEKPKGVIIDLGGGWEFFE